MFSSKRKEITDWFGNLGGESPSEIVKNAFQARGYVYEECVYYGMETEIDSNE